MRDDFFLRYVLEFGGTLITATIVMFFVVLAFRKESITFPALFKWAVCLLSAALLLPMMMALISMASSSSSPYGRDGSETLMIIVSAAAPLLFLTSIVLALISLLPAPRRIHPTANRTQHPGEPISFGPVTAQPSTTPEKPHPLD